MWLLSYPQPEVERDILVLVLIHFALGSVRDSKGTGMSFLYAQDPLNSNSNLQRYIIGRSFRADYILVISILFSRSTQDKQCQIYIHVVSFVHNIFFSPYPINIRFNDSKGIE